MFYACGEFEIELPTRFNVLTQIGYWEWEETDLLLTDLLLIYWRDSAFFSIRATKANHKTVVEPLYEEMIHYVEPTAQIFESFLDATSLLLYKEFDLRHKIWTLSSQY